MTLAVPDNRRSNIKQWPDSNLVPSTWSLIFMLPSRISGPPSEFYSGQSVKNQAALSSAPASASQRHKPPRSCHSLGFVAFAVLLTLAFIYPLTSLLDYALENELHSHILAIPFICAYLLYARRKNLPGDYQFSPRCAALALIGGLGGLLVACSPWPANRILSHGDSLSAFAFSFVCLLFTGGFVFLGRKWMAAAAFPAAFLLFMVPLPSDVVTHLETASQLLSAETASLLFTITGTPMLREGTIFQLPGIVIEVAQECSGIRSSWVLLITSVLTGELFLKDAWRRALLIAFVVPLAILRNGFRILVIGLLCVYLGPDMINSMIHRHGGPIFFTLSLIPLLLLLCWLQKGEIPATSKRAVAAVPLDS